MVSLQAMVEGSIWGGEMELKSLGLWPMMHETCLHMNE